MEIFGLGRVGPHFDVLLDVSCAFVPLLLSLWLFRTRRVRNAVWWFGTLVFVAFLPTAPYTLTDIIHFIAAIREEPPLSVHYIVLVLIPSYGLYMLACFQAYVISVILLGHYLTQRGVARPFIMISELLLGFISAIGVYLGRFQRLSSWNLVNEPFQVFREILQDFVQASFWIFIIESFLIISALYYTLKWINTALWQTYAPSGRIAGRRRKTNVSHKK